MDSIVSKLLGRTKKACLGLAIAMLSCAGLGSVGAASARADGGPRIHAIHQDGNNVTITYFIPNGGFSYVQTRWDGPGSDSRNEHQQKFRLGFGSYFTYTIPNIQSYQRYVFKVQGYSGTWSSWQERHFTTRGLTYRGYLYRKK
jgi:hypothetical protein